MLFSCEKIDRGTNTQSDPAGLRMFRNVSGKNLLLRHSQCQKNQRSSCPDNEVDALLNLDLGSDEPHGRCVTHNVEAGILARQRVTIRCYWTDEGYHETLLLCTRNEERCQITACDDGQLQAL